MEKQLKLLHYLNKIGLLVLVISAYMAVPWLQCMKTLDNKPLPSDNPRTAYMVQEATDLAMRLGIPAPKLSISQDPSAPFTNRVIGSPAVISLSEDMLSPKNFTNSQVRAILAHELAHAASWDSYRFYKVIGSLHRQMEADADCQAAQLVGSAAMEDLFTAHLDRVIAGAMNPDDVHPTLEYRIATVRHCGQVRT